MDGFRVVSATPPAWMRERVPFKLYRLAFLLGFVRAVRGQRPAWSTPTTPPCSCRAGSPPA